MKRQLPTRPADNKPWSATFLQTRRAYQAHYGETIPAGMTYQEAANCLTAALGFDAARTFIQSMSNDPKDPE